MVDLRESVALVTATDVGSRRTARVTAELAARYGDSVAGWQLDVSDRDRVDQVLAEVVERLGPIDVLVNNAGVNVLGDANDLAPEDRDRVLAVNLSAPWSACTSGSWHRSGARNASTRRSSRIRPPSGASVGPTRSPK